MRRDKLEIVGLSAPLTGNLAGLILQLVASDSTFTGSLGYRTQVLLVDVGRELIRIVGCFNMECCVGWRLGRELLGSSLIIMMGSFLSSVLTSSSCSCVGWGERGSTFT